jgi:protein disulfide-isomerase A6
MRFSLFAVAAAFVGGALASNVVDLDPQNFDTLIGKGAPALVELCVR